MKKPISISIIIPIYNSEKYVKKTMSSIVSQTLKDIEIICINDCSTDDSLKMLKRVQKSDKRIKIINNKKNLGPGISRNLGILKSKGEYIHFLDSDDWLERDACELLYKKAKKENADVVFIRPKIVFKNKTILDRRLLSNKDVQDREIVFKKTLTRKVAWAPWSKLIKKDLLIKNKIKFPNIHIAEDMQFSCEVIHSTKKISQVKKYLYNYYIRDGSLMSFSHPERRIKNYLKSIKLMKKFLNKKEILKKYKREFLHFKFYNYSAIYGVMFYSKEKLNKEYYKNIISKDRDFKISKIITVKPLDSVIVASILIKSKMFNPVFKFREKLRIILGKWGKRSSN